MDTYENKYKEALEKMKSKLKNFNKIIINRSDIEEIFPELKESEDERIRGAIIDHLKDNNLTEWAAWLEKQGEQEPVDEAEPKFHIGDKIRFFRKGTTNEEPMTITKINEKGYWSGDLFICNFIDADKRLKLIEQKPTDKVEPKFKVGDWITDGNIHCKISDILDDRYIVDTKFAKRSCITFKCEREYHLWTIQDAKDGDVLATKNFVFIFKNIDDENGVHYYCHYEIRKHEDDNQFGIALPQSLMGRVGNSFTHYSPATKGQRDLLFQEMKKAGYEWDAEKKESKKIKNRPMLSDFLNAEYERGKADALKCVRWSEEDERLRRKLIELIYSVSYCDERENLSNWLKSLKPQPKQEWSDEDEEMCQETIDWFEKKCFPYALESENPARESIKWLKSIKQKIEG